MEPEFQPCTDIMKECSAPQGATNFGYHAVGAAMTNNFDCYIRDDAPPNLGETSNGSYFWTEDLLSRARLVTGDVSRLQSAVKLANGGRCLNVGIIGGSHCGGKCLHDPEGSNFFSLLLRDLNALFPCTGHNKTSHSGWSECRGGTPSSTHVYETRRLIAQHSPVDIVIFEFANNDNEYSDKTHLFQQNWQLEYIVRKWMDAGAAPLFVSSSFHIVPGNRYGEAYALSAERTHLPFLQRYAIPTLSFLHAVLPQYWTHRKDRDSKYFEVDIFADYRAHMVERGHAIVSAMITESLLRMVDEEPVPFKPPIDFEFISRDYYEVLEQEVFHHVEFTKVWEPRTTAHWLDVSSEWQLSDENRGKWGLVSTEVASSVAVRLDGATRMYITVLKSYDNVGKYSVALEGCQEDQERGFVVDCLWESRSSQSAIDEFSVDSCETAVITIVESRRPTNKIKVLALALTRA